MNFWDCLEIFDICLIHTFSCCNQRHDPMSDIHFQFLFLNFKKYMFESIFCFLLFILTDLFNFFDGET